MSEEYIYYESRDNHYNVSVSRVGDDEMEVYLESKTYYIEGLPLKAMKVVDQVVKAAYLQGIKTAKFQMRNFLSSIDGEV
jgi:hypothetical protein